MVELEDLPLSLRTSKQNKPSHPIPHTGIYEDIINDFESNGISSQLIKVCLQELKNCQNRCLGRGKLCVLLNNIGWEISENRLKRVLSLLGKHNLVRTGKTRQGTTITRQGIQMLANGVLASTDKETNTNEPSSFFI